MIFNNGGIREQSTINRELVGQITLLTLSNLTMNVKNTRHFSHNNLANIEI